MMAAFASTHLAFIFFTFNAVRGQTLNEGTVSPVLVADIPDPITTSMIAGTPPVNATDDDGGTELTESVYLLPSIIMLLVIGCSAGVLISIFCICIICMSCQNKKSEPIRIRCDVNPKQIIKKRDMSADLKKLSPQLSPSEMSTDIDIQLPPSQTKMVNAAETMNSVKVECETPNIENMGFSGYRDYVDFVNEGIEQEACYSYAVTTAGGGTSSGSDVIIEDV